jgi:hypothetical protein
LHSKIYPRGIFGLKIYHLATLPWRWAAPLRRRWKQDAGEVGVGRGCVRRHKLDGEGVGGWTGGKGWGRGVRQEAIGKGLFRCKTTNFHTQERIARTVIRFLFVNLLNSFPIAQLWKCMHSYFFLQT